MGWAGKKIGMSYTFAETVVLVTIDCADCAVAFAIPKRMQQVKLEQRGTFYCPNGHANTYADTEIDRLRREVTRKTAEANGLRERYFTEQREHEKTQKALKRIRKRTANGVCPCCHRSFKQLASHMKVKHPDFIEQEKSA